MVSAPDPEQSDLTKSRDDSRNTYRQLVARVNELCRGIEQALPGQITCSAGCSDCCTSITIFPVEAAALGQALASLPSGEAEAIRRHVAEHAARERCPLLSNQRCLLYAARPIICRSHGLPILFTEDDRQRIDCCPLNPLDVESLTGPRIIDLDKLNTLLVAINALFLRHSGTASDLPERLTIAQALLPRK